MTSSMSGYFLLDARRLPFDAADGWRPLRFIKANLKNVCRTKGLAPARNYCLTLRRCFNGLGSLFVEMRGCRVRQLRVTLKVSQVNERENGPEQPSKCDCGSSHTQRTPRMGGRLKDSHCDGSRCQQTGEANRIICTAYIIAALRDPLLRGTPLVHAANKVITRCRTTLAQECLASTHHSLVSIILLAGFDFYNPAEDSPPSPQPHYPQNQTYQESDPRYQKRFDQRPV